MLRWLALCLATPLFAQIDLGRVLPEGDNLHFIIPPEQNGEIAPSQRFIIHNERPDFP